MGQGRLELVSSRLVVHVQLRRVALVETASREPTLRHEPAAS